MKVFISSTYVDLIEHRKAAHDALEQLGLHVIWMDAFGARPVESTKACLDEVEESDLFVGIYAHRYGYIPAGSSVSITEQEFDHAQKLGKPIFGFVINDEHPWSPKLVEHDKKDKLNAFLTKVKKQPVEFFTTPDNLAQNIASSVGHYLSEINSTNSNRQSQIENRKSPTGNTLPTQPYFFGRAKELEIIKSALSPDSRTWGALIDGPGGIGKTALAIKAAHDALAELFERKIFITAKVRELTAEGEAKLTDFTRPTYLAMLDELGKELGENNLEKLAPDDRPDTLRLALAGKQALIIFDNLETLPEEERTRLFQFLSRLPEGNKAIVTSRRRTDVDARIVRLDRLARDEALQLIAELAAKYPRLARASQKEREDLYEITQGNPLFIRWIAGQLGREGSQSRTIAEASAFIDKAPKGNDPLEYIFGDLLETFTADETKVLAALTYFSLPAKLKWIADMTDLPARAAETALEDLTDRSILTSDLPKQTYFLPPLTAKFIRKKRAETVDNIGNQLANQADEKADWLGNHGIARGEYSAVEHLEDDWPFIYAALPKIFEGSDFQIQSLCDSLGEFLHITGRWDEEFILNNLAEQKASKSGNNNIAGWRSYRLGMLYAEHGQGDELLACAERTEKYWGNRRARDKAIVLQMKGKGFYLKKEYQKAVSLFREALEIHRIIDTDGYDIAITLNSLGLAEEESNDFLSAERDFREAIEFAKKQKHGEGIDTFATNLALLLLKLQKWEEAKEFASEAASWSEYHRRYLMTANNYITMAKALENQDRIIDGQYYIQEAIEIYTRFGKNKLLEYAQDLLAKYESKSHTKIKMIPKENPK